MTTQTPTLEPGLERELESHRRELTGYCYRMLGSGSEAEDAVQDTMIRAWRNIDKLDERAALRAWLYRIAHNICLDMLKGAQRRARPMDLSSPATAESQLDPGLPEVHWLQPVADAQVLPESGDPAEVAASKETLRLAFVAALQHLPPKQRAVLILCEVLRWKASEAAELLGTSTASVNSALQRARATLDDMQLEPDRAPASVDGKTEQELLAKYVDAFERYDVASIVALLHDDATFQMPPFQLWLRGTDDIGKWFVGQGIGCKGAKVLPTSANGSPAAAIYRIDPDGGWMPFNLCVLEIGGGRITGVHNFLYPELFPAFGLPEHLD